MITLKSLEAVFGENGLGYFEYLVNKNRGGISNNKGNTFENFFTVYKIAKSFNENINPGDIYFSSQVFCFVDDLVVEQLAERNHWFYQIKDIASLEWNNRPENSVRDDFKNQHAICVREGIHPYLSLVVSDKIVYDHLIATKPDDIRTFVKVVNFRPATSLNNLIRDNANIREELIKMCALENPSSDKLNTLAAILLGVWDSTDKKKVSLKEVLDRCYNISPHYIKGFSRRISKGLEEIIKSINGLDYKVEGGFLKWNFRNTDEGVIQYRIGSTEFEKWENDLYNATILTFEDLEPFLVS
jgi:hypothetical protein